MKYVGIIGSRRRTDRASVHELVDSLDVKNTTVVSGGCYGVDMWAELRAKSRGIAVIRLRPRTSTYMSYLKIVEAMYARNKEIAEKSDIVYAFVAKDRKGGVENCIKHAKKLKKKVVIM
jgi:hypothetical protein